MQELVNWVIKQDGLVDGIPFSRINKMIILRIRKINQDQRLLRKTSSVT